MTSLWRIGTTVSEAPWISRTGAVNLSACRAGETASIASRCWFEIWAGGEVEHGRVALVMPKQMLRVAGAFGPLQDLGVSAVMTFTLADGVTDGTTRLTLDYKAVGSSLSGLDQMVPLVD